MIPNDCLVPSFVGGLRLGLVVVVVVVVVVLLLLGGDDGEGEDSRMLSLPPPRWRMRIRAVCPLQLEAQLEVTDGFDEHCRWKGVAADSANRKNNDKTTDFLTILREA